MSSVRALRVTFTGGDGSSRLAARVDLPAGCPRGWALFAHCFTCTHNVLAATRIAEGLTSRGIAVLRFDFTGLGASEGDFANTNFSSNVGDLLAAAAWLRAEHQAPALMIGHSLGGAAVLAAAGGVPEARAFCTINAPAEPAHLAKALKPAVAEIEARGEAEVRLAGQTFRIKKQLLDDIAGHKLAYDVTHLGRPLLILHAPRDETVSIDNAAKLFALARHPKSFVSLDDADHLLTRRVDAVSVARIIAAWVDRYLDPTEEAGSAATPAEAEAGVVVTESGTGKYAQTISVRGRHTLRADEPAEFGGSDSGPNPYEYLLAGLGACTSMTMRMYADRKGLPLEGVSVTLHQAKVHAQDCADCETKVGLLDRITREIEATGPLDQQARQKLLEIADKCPVHRTLQSEVVVETTLKD